MQIETPPLNDFFINIESAWDCPPLTPGMISHAQNLLGVKLPRSYLELLSIRNGGLVKKRNFLYSNSSLETPFVFSFSCLYGIGGENSIDSIREDGESLNRKLIVNWGYPEKGIVICHFGHNGFSLDYSRCGPDGEPEVVYTHAERQPIFIVTVSPTFREFLSQLYVPEDYQELPANLI